MNFLDQKGKRVHLLGIGGVGMTALAWYLADCGWKVSGSDCNDFRMRNLLESKGITVHTHHDPSFSDHIDLLIYSSAVPQDLPELSRARQNCVPLYERMEAIHKILQTKKLVGVTGSYGKSTTTTFVSSMMQKAGMNPNWLIGADLLHYPPAHYADSSWMVLECDESKSKFLSVLPQSLLITNVGKDHLQEYEHSMEKLAEAFASLAEKVPQEGCVVINGDDPLLTSYIKNVKGKAQVIRCGNNEKSEFYFSELHTKWNGSRFTSHFMVNTPEGRHIQAQIPMPGWQNILDALMAYALIFFYTKQLPGGDYFSSLPIMDRRMEVKTTYKNCIVLDDEGDSPDVIEWALKALRSYFPEKKIVSVVQPHRFSRLSNLFEEYARVLCQNASDIMLLPVYSAGELPLDGVNSSTLAKKIRDLGFQGTVDLVEDHQEAAQKLQSELNNDTLVITMGPGDVWRVGDLLSDYVKTQP
jgi:UDP-N-acetylmuramate--alanine ligase